MFIMLLCYNLNRFFSAAIPFNLAKLAENQPKKHVIAQTIRSNCRCWLFYLAQFTMYGFLYGLRMQLYIPLSEYHRLRVYSVYACLIYSACLTFQKRPEFSVSLFN